MCENEKEKALADLLEKNIVIDTKGSMIAIGRLVRIASDCLVLDDADVHDREEGYSSKELYVLNARKSGIQPSRKKVYIPNQNILAVSALEDFIAD
jgi:hypothetical protein